MTKATTWLLAVGIGSAALADDGDGDLDVLSASERDDTIAWYANDGTGGFGARQVITTEAYGARFVAAADLDGDGKPDVISGSEYDSKIAWYRNQGGGHFGAPQVISWFGVPWGFFIADVDSDGDLDIFTSVIWYPNDGTGRFGAEQAIATAPAGADSTAIADLDGDGRVDLLLMGFVDGDDKIIWYRNLGAGQFGPGQVIANGSFQPDSILTTADLDADGDLDVISAGEWDDILWYRNQGDGTFSAGEKPGGDSHSALSIATADLNSDGHLDLLFAAHIQDQIGWYPGQGGGRFGEQRDISASVVTPGSVIADDLDGDGDPDLLSVSLRDGKIAWYPNQGQGRFGRQQVIAIQHGALSATTADLDGDGDRDVLSAHTHLDGGSTISWFANQGAGQFGAPQVISDAFGSSLEVRSVAAADLDDDRNPDVLIGFNERGTYGNEKIAWYRNLGAGRFGAQQMIDPAGSGNLVTSADLDGDGRVDVVSESGSIAWYRNLGAGVLDGPRIIGQTGGSCHDWRATVGANTLAIADLDGDNDLDVISPDCGDDSIAWYPNQGNGQFGAERLLAARSHGAGTVAVADLNRDGDLDVLTAFHNDATLAWYPNQGAGQFGAERVINPGVPFASFVTVADLDGDGDADVVSASQGFDYFDPRNDDNRITWYENLLGSTNGSIAPTVVAGGDQTGSEGAPMTFAGSFTDPDVGDTHDILWDFGDGTRVTGTLNPTHSFMDDGSYRVRLRVTDNHGAPGTDTLTVTVSNVAPTCDAGPDQTVDEGETVQLSGSQTDPGADPQRYCWSLDDDWPDCDRTGPSPTYVYTDDLPPWDETVALTCSDGDGGETTDSLRISVANVPPTAEAGPDQRADEGATLSFSGSHTDPGSADTHSYAWAFGDGTTATGTDPTHAYADEGSYTVTLTVTDDDGGSDTDTLTATISNVPPTCDAGPDRYTSQGETLQLQASLSDPGSADTHSYAWTLGDGTTATGQSPTHVYGSAGAYPVTLSCTDNDGGSDTDTLIVQVAAFGCDAGDARSADEGEPVVFSATATDLPADSYVWQFGDGASATGQTVTHSYADDGSYPVLLTVAAGAAGSCSRRVDTTIANVAPSADAGADRTADEGASVRFAGSHSDPGSADTHSYAWAFGDGATATGQSPTHVYADNGSYTVTLSVTDDDGGSASDALSISIVNRAPSADAGADRSAGEGATLSFSGSHTDPGSADTHSYAWAFGDGTTATGTDPTHAYADNGSYTVRLTVTDDDGGSDSDSLTVSVANLPPSVDAGADQTVDLFEDILLSGAFTDPGSADTHTIEWDLGDGWTATGSPTPTHRYAAPGRYRVELLVTDDDGGWARDSLEVEVLCDACLPRRGGWRSLLPLR